MWNITYEEWEEFVRAFLNTPNNKLNKHLQTYPFSKLNENQKKYLISEEFFNSVVKNGQFFGPDGNLNVVGNILQKNNGDLRNVTLVTPTQYLIFIVLGGHLAKRIDENSEYSLRYCAGNLYSNDLYYANSYKEFTVNVKMQGAMYSYFYKNDFSNFFGNIDLSLLFNRIQELIPEEDPRTLLIFRNLIEYFGNGRFPTIDGNPGLSFIATECYLSLFDEKLYASMEKFLEPKDFSIIRYVDDTYIFFDCSDHDYARIKNEIETSFQEIMKQLRLDCNHAKQKFGTGEDVTTEIRQSLYDYETQGKDIDYGDYFDRGNLENLFSNLLKLNDRAGFDEVEKIFEDSFYDVNFKFHYTEVLNWYIYDKSEYFQDKKVIKLLFRLATEKYYLFRFYSKQFVRMLINTKEDKLVKKFLNEAFVINRSKGSSRYQVLMILEYLLATNFHHADLKLILKEYSSVIYEYILNYCDGQFVQIIENETTGFTSMSKSDYALNFLWFMSKFYEKKSMILEEYAYYKNYFDRKLSYLFAQLGIQGVAKKSGKISWNYTYNSGSVVKALEKLGIEENIRKIVGNSYQLRNHNPVSHASSELLEQDSLKTSELIKSMKTLEEVINILNDLSLNSGIG